MCPSQRTLPGKYDTRDMGVNHIVYTVSKYAFRPQKVKRKETSNVIMDGYIYQQTPLNWCRSEIGRPFWSHHPDGSMLPPHFHYIIPLLKGLYSEVSLNPVRSCSSCLFPSRVFNQIASTTNLFSPIFYIIQSFPWTETYLKNIPSFQLLFNFPTNMEKLPLL